MTITNSVVENAMKAANAKFLLKGPASEFAFAAKSTVNAGFQELLRKLRSFKDAKMDKAKKDALVEGGENAAKAVDDYYNEIVAALEEAQRSFNSRL